MTNLQGECSYRHAEEEEQQEEEEEEEEEEAEEDEGEEEEEEEEEEIQRRSSACSPDLVQLLLAPRLPVLGTPVVRVLHSEPFLVTESTQYNQRNPPKVLSGRDLHSSNFELKLTASGHSNHPIHPAYPTESAQVKPKIGQWEAVPVVRLLELPPVRLHETDLVQSLRALGTDGYRLPHHPPHCRPSFPELSGITRRGEHVCHVILHIVDPSSEL